jgi:hypothetical protein
MTDVPSRGAEVEGGRDLSVPIRQPSKQGNTLVVTDL